MKTPLPLSKRAGHSHVDWPSGGSCHSQAFSQLSTKVAGLLANTIFILQLTTFGVQCTLPSVQFPKNVFLSTGVYFPWPKSKATGFLLLFD